MNIKRTVKPLVKKAKKYAPEIWGLIASGGVVLTTYITKKQTEKIMTVKQELGEEKYNQLPVMEKAKITGVNHVAIIACGTATIASIMTSCVLGRKQINAAIGAYIIAQQKYMRFKRKVKEVVGEEKAKEITEELDDDNLSHVSKMSQAYYSEDFLNLSNEEIIIYEPYTETIMIGTMELVKELEMAINRNFHPPMIGYDGLWAITLADVFEFINVKPNNKPLANMIGWNITWLNNEYESDWLGVAAIKTGEEIYGKPVYKLYFDVDPSYSGLRFDY